MDNTEYAEAVNASSSPSSLGNEAGISGVETTPVKPTDVTDLTYKNTSETPSATMPEKDVVIDAEENGAETIAAVTDLKQTVNNAVSDVKTQIETGHANLISVATDTANHAASVAQDVAVLKQAIPNLATDLKELIAAEFAKLRSDFGAFRGGI